MVKIGNKLINSKNNCKKYTLSKALNNPADEKGHNGNCVIIKAYILHKCGIKAHRTLLKRKTKPAYTDFKAP